MQVWNVTMTALQPLSIAREPNRESHWDTAWNIPGSTWRGAIAELWKFKVGFDHPLTNELFEQSIFHDAHPLDTSFYPSFWRVSKSSGKYEEILTTYLTEHDFKTNHSSDGGMLVDIAPFKHTLIENQAVGIMMSETREAVRHGQLYTLSAVAEGTIFQTIAELPEDALALVGEQTETGYELEVYVGKKRFSGYGKMKCTFTKLEDLKSKETIKTKIEQSPYQKEDSLHVVLTNKSPLILRDGFFRPTNEIDWEIHILPLSNKPDIFMKMIAKISRQFSWGKTDIRHGWNQAWNAPKPTESTISTGTTHVTTFVGLSDEDKDHLYDVLSLVEAKGLGERTNEGFGEILVAPSLAIEEDKEYNSTEQQEENPDSNLLSLAQKFVDKIGKGIPQSQWHSVLKLEDIIDELMTKQEGKYLHKRLESPVRNTWKKSVGKRTTGELLRQYLQIVIDDNKQNASRSVETFVHYIARYSQIQKSEEGEEK